MSLVMRSRFALYVGLFLLTSDSSLFMNQALRHFNGRREEKLRVRLSLRVEQQRERAAAAKAAMQQKIHREQIRQLEALHLSFAHIIEIPLHERGRQMLEHPCINRLGPRDDADVGRVPLVAGTREAQPHQRYADSAVR